MHRIEAERDLLEQRLRRLERELAELRRGARPTPESPSGGEDGQLLAGLDHRLEPDG